MDEKYDLMKAKSPSTLHSIKTFWAKQVDTTF